MPHDTKPSTIARAVRGNFYSVTAIGTRGSDAEHSLEIHFVFVNAEALILRVQYQLNLSDLNENDVELLLREALLGGRLLRYPL